MLPYTRHLAICLLLALSAQATPREVTIAAASNLTEVFQTLGPEFEKATGIHPIFSFGSTAQLTQQIEASAPFDVFLAADSEHIRELEEKGLLLPRSRALYATGVLALWIPPGSSVASFADLTNPSVRVIAIAKPELAPYGKAAIEALQRLNLWDKVQPKVVYASNISAAKQYGQSGNADAVFTALSLVQKEPGRVMPVVEALHEPITQELGIIADTKNEKAARAFVNFLLRGKGRDVLAKSGYRVP